MFPACCFNERTYMAQGLVNGVLNETLKTTKPFFMIILFFYSSFLASFFVLRSYQIALIFAPENFQSYSLQVNYGYYKFMSCAISILLDEFISRGALVSVFIVKDV